MPGKHPVLFTRHNARNETEESDPTTTLELMLVRFSNYEWIYKVLLCPIRRPAALCNWGCSMRIDFGQACRACREMANMVQEK